MSPRRRDRRRFLPVTLRARVTALAAVAVLGVLAAASVGLVLAQRVALVEALDEGLDVQADAVSTQVRAGVTVRDRDLPSDDLLVEVLSPDGRRIAASRGLEGPLSPDDGVPDRGPVTTVALPGDAGEGRLLTRSVDGVTVLVASSLEDVDDSTTALAGLLLVAVPLTGLALAGVVSWAVGRALRPVEDIRARVDSISASRLDQRVPEPDTPREIARLARTMNAMLGRLQQSADRQRRFVADASHELRSPLARMRTELEVDAAHPGAADPEATAVSVLGETVGLQHLVEDLLLLARGDAGALVPRAVLIDLDEVVIGQSVRFGVPGPQLDRSGVRPVQVHGDRSQLERAVGNLLDNAVRHARNRVRLTLGEERDGSVVLTVDDDGPGVPAADRDRVFERFTRLDEARAGGDGGAGLGLAIARDVVERHGGSLDLDTSPDGGARFVVRMPAAPDGLPATGPG